MKILIMLLTISVLTVKSQSNCNLDKIETFTYSSDTIDKVIFYYSDNKNYIVIYKNNKSELARELFKLKFISANSLDNITNITGAPITKTDSLTLKTTYYSLVDNKYISFIKNIWVLEDAKEISRTKNKFIVSLKVGCGQFNENFDLEYTSNTLIPKNANIIWLLKNSKLTCIMHTGTDF